MSETLTWGSEELSGPITCEDLGLLRNFVTRGRNRILPRAPGTRGLAPVRDELDVTLTWSVDGRFDPDGTPHADKELGAEQNAEHYRSVFTAPGDPDTGETAISLAYAGQTYEGAAQLREYAQGRTGPGNFRILTRLIVTAGQLEEAGS